MRLSEVKQEIHLAAAAVQRLRHPSICCGRGHTVEACLLIHYCSAEVAEARPDAKAAECFDAVHLQEVDL